MGLLNVCGVGVRNELTRLVHPAATFPLAAPPALRTCRRAPSPPWAAAAATSHAR